jgi:hypothetical protein
MSVEPIAGEQGRFFVESKSGREPHVVDLAYRLEPWMRPRCACGCESSFIYGRVCAHIWAAVRFELERIKLETT